MWQFSWVKSWWSMMDHQFLGYPTGAQTQFGFEDDPVRAAQQQSELMRRDAVGRPDGWQQSGTPSRALYILYAILKYSCFCKWWVPKLMEHESVWQYLEWGNGCFWAFRGHPFWEHPILPANHWHGLGTVLPIGGSDCSDCPSHSMYDSGTGTFVSIFMLFAVQPARTFPGTASEKILRARICMPASRWLALDNTSHGAAQFSGHPQLLQLPKTREQHPQRWDFYPDDLDSIYADSISFLRHAIFWCSSLVPPSSYPTSYIYPPLLHIVTIPEGLLKITWNLLTPASRIGSARLQPCMAVLSWSLAILSCYAQEDVALPWHYAGQLNSSLLCGYGNGFRIFPSCKIL